MKPLIESKYVKRIHEIQQKQSAKSLKFRFDIHALLIDAEARGIAHEEVAKMVVDEGVIMTLMDNEWNQSTAARVLKMHRNVVTRHIQRWVETVGEWLK